MNVYCGSRFVELVQRGGWLYCTGCDRKLWEVGETFAVDTPRIDSRYGSEEDSTVEGHCVEEGPVAGRAVQAGDA